MPTAVVALLLQCPLHLFSSQILALQTSPAVLEGDVFTTSL